MGHWLLGLLVHAYLLTRRSKRLSVGTQLQRPQAVGMRRDDADTVGFQVHNLYLTRRPTGKDQILLRQTAEAVEVVGRLILSDGLGRLVEGIHAHAVLQDDGDPRLRDLHAAHRGQGGYLQSDLALAVVPYYDFVLRELGRAATADQSKIVGVAHHLDEAKAGIEYYDLLDSCLICGQAYIPLAVWIWQVLVTKTMRCC